MNKRLAQVKFFKIPALLISVLLFSASAESQTRLKDIASIQGMEHASIQGIGLVTGLSGTGDGTQIIPTIRAMTNVLKNYGITIDENRLRMRNAALVIITASVPPFAKRGTRIDLTLATIGDAQSLEGGVLSQSYLADMSGVKVASAQGPITIGGSNRQGGTQNFAASGRVVKGGTLIGDIALNFESENEFKINLHLPDFTTAFRVATSIDNAFGESTAEAIDPSTIIVKINPEYSDNNRKVEFISLVEQISIVTDLPAKVVINERTGTVIVGAEVRLSEVLITHQDITINIAQPQGQPAGQQAQGQAVYLNKSVGSSIGDLAGALNALQVAPRDMIAIFQALKAQGALKAELVIL